jgi:replication-associated recombination protein RarA
MKLEDMIHDAEHPLSAIKEMLSEGNLPDLLLHGPPGTGKTTTAHAIASHVGADIHEFNASDERGIDFIRNRVKEVATQRGYSDHTIILLDEADGLTKQAQDALRRIIETGHALFILTANDYANITGALKSRCLAFNFRPYNAEEVLTLLQTRFPNLTTEHSAIVAAAWNGDLREIAGSTAQTYANPSLSIVGGDWESLRKELLILTGVSTISMLNRLHDRVRQLDMEPARFHHYSRIWGDAVLAAHQWPLGYEGFVDWFVGSLASLWDKEE